MGTKLNDYLRDAGAAKNSEEAGRRDAFGRAYSLAADLIELRLRRGLTQTQLAEATGVAQSEISRIERGVIHPGDKTWARLADALGAELRLVETRQPRARQPQRRRRGPEPAGAPRRS
jgi:transcriptional regulator with XRE-family HTH domain